MGWLWGTKSSEQDAYSSLDPKLKGFLDEQSAQHQQQRNSATRSETARLSSPSAATSDVTPPSSKSHGATDTSPAAAAAAAAAVSAPPTELPTTPTSTVPSQSLYQDGRYAHLWSTYRAPSTISYRSSSEDLAGTPSAQDQLTSMINEYRSKQAELSRAALANCVEEQLAENECWAGMSWSKVGGLCRAEAREFSRCCTLQARFLRAMGYMDIGDGAAGGATGPAAEKRVRDAMLSRADEIWAEVKRRRRAEDEAQSKSLPMPVFPPMKEFKPATALVAVGAGDMGKQGAAGRKPGERDAQEREKVLMASLVPEKRLALQETLRDMTPTDRELEVKLQLAEVEDKLGYSAKLNDYYKQEAEDRRARKAAGKSTLGDYLKYWGGWSQ